MKCVVDVSVVLAVVLDEPERDWAIAATSGWQAYAPHSYPFEIGNALSALVKRRRLSEVTMRDAWSASRSFAVTFHEIDMEAALNLAASNGIYAYDAYMLRCAIELNATLLTLDNRLTTVARALSVRTLER